MMGLELIAMLKGISYAEIGGKIGLTRQAVSVWMKRGSIPESKLDELSEILGYPKDYLTSKVDVENLEKDIHKYLLK